MRLRNAASVALRVSVAVGILHYIFRRVVLAEILAAIASAPVGYLTMAFGLTIVMHAIAGYRFKVLTGSQGISLTTFQAVEINLATVFYSLFLPGGNLSGGIIRFHRVSGKNRKMGQAFASIVYDRVVATIALCVVGIAFWIASGPRESGYLALTMALLVGGLLAAGLLRSWYMLASRLGKSLDHDPESRFLGRVRRNWLIVARYSELRPRLLASILALSLTSHLLGVIGCYVLALSVGIDLPLGTMGWVRSAVVLITMIPISVSGLGLREGALLLLLKPYGIWRENVLALSLLMFCVTVLAMGILGGLLEGWRFVHPVLAGIGPFRQRRGNKSD